jgi:hypothetical protein
MCTSVTLSVGSKVTTKSDHQKPWLNMNEPVRVATTAWRRSWRASWRRVRPGRSRRRCRGSGTMSRHWSHSSPPFPGFERPHSVGGVAGPRGKPAPRARINAQSRRKLRQAPHVTIRITAAHGSNRSVRRWGCSECWQRDQGKENVIAQIQM